MNRTSRRLTSAEIQRQIVAYAKRPWQTMEWVPREEWPPNCQRMGRIIGLWRNNKYLCMEFPETLTVHGRVRHLIIERVTGERATRWTVLQRIKNETVGPDAVAIEMYPSKSKAVEDYHVYHLWVLPEGYPLPGVGLNIENAP